MKRRKRGSRRGGTEETWTGKTGQTVGRSDGPIICRFGRRDAQTYSRPPEVKSSR